jgi:hypothetical protein
VYYYIAAKDIKNVNYSHKFPLLTVIVIIEFDRSGNILSEQNLISIFLFFSSHLKLVSSSMQTSQKQQPQLSIPTTTATITTATATSTRESGKSIFDFPKSKNILFYNSFFHWKDFLFGFGHEPFQTNKCPGVNFINILHTDFSYAHCFGSFF